MKKGFILVNVLVFGVIAIIVTTSLVTWGGNMLKNTKQLSAREQAFQIAEAGIDYYRWHLAHAPNDYKDGTATTTNGPFIHDFEDKDGNVIGKFELTITPPLTGSTLVKIVSKGTVTEYPSVYRKIQATLAIPSFAKYAVVANSAMRFGAGTIVQGPIHSNGGVRFDGVAYNIVTSAKDKYIDTDVSASWYQFGVYTTVGPSELNNDATPPTTIPNRQDVFKANRDFPVATVDFNGITSDLSQMKTNAQSNGKHFLNSGAQGYHVVFKTNDTYDVYTVNNLHSAPSGCDSDGTTGWGIWSIRVNSSGNIVNHPSSGYSQTFLNNYPNPANGIIFMEDNVWVDGQINGARITLVAAKFPDSGTRPNIIVNSDLLYTNKDGTDVIALISQGNVLTGLISENDLEIDAALIAQNGKAGRYYYESSCRVNGTNFYDRDTLTLYGMIGSNLRYGYAYTDGTGYNTRNIVYDGNLLYGPPPSFPLTSSQYTTLSWEEIR